jgi:hypothetical protein
MESPIYALVDNDDAQVALPDQLAAIAFDGDRPIRCWRPHPRASNQVERPSRRKDGIRRSRRGLLPCGVTLMTHTKGRRTYRVLDRPRRPHIVSHNLRPYRSSARSTGDFRPSPHPRRRGRSISLPLKNATAPLLPKLLPNLVASDMTSGDERSRRRRNRQTIRAFR